MSTWFTADDEDALDRVLNAWPDAPETEEQRETLEMILDTACAQVIAYAQGLPDDAILGDYKLVDADGEEVTDIPPRLAYAQIRHAEELWNAGRTGSEDGSLGIEGGFVFTPRTISATIRQIIRPRAVPSVA